MAAKVIRNQQRILQRAVFHRGGGVGGGLRAQEPPWSAPPRFYFGVTNFWWGKDYFCLPCSLTEPRMNAGNLFGTEFIGQQTETESER